MTTYDSNDSRFRCNVPEKPYDGDPLGNESRTRYPVRFEWDGRGYNLTVEDARELIRTVYAGIDACRAKCPTCRCRILPGEVCSCCAQPACVEDSE